MITWMQKHRKYLVVTIWISTIAFVGAGFLGWGAYKLGGGSSDTIAKVGTINLTNKDLQAKYSNIFNYYNQMLGGQLNKQKAKELKLQDIALNELFKDAMYENYAKELGLSVSPKETLKQIASIPAFLENGTFSESKYNYILRNLGTNSKEFKRQIKKSLLIDKLFNALKLQPTSLEEQTLFSTLYLQDKLKYEIKTDKAITITITDDEIKKYWEENKAKYKTQKTFTLDIIENNSSNINVTDDEIKSLYHDKQFLFKGKDGKILTLEKAYEDVKKVLQDKKSKKDILKKYIKFKNHKIKADKTITVTRFNSAIPMQKVITTNVGAFIKSIKTKAGYACAYLKEITQPKELSYEKAKELAKKDLESVKKQEALVALGKQLSKNLTNPKESLYLTKTSIDKVEFLDKSKAIEFLNYLFSSTKKQDYYVYDDKVIAYEIVDQKLFDKDLFEKQKSKLSHSLENLKSQTIREAILKSLQQKYKIEKYYKQKDKS